MARTRREEPATETGLVAAFATKADLAAFELRFTNKLYAVAGVVAALIVATRLIP